MKGFYYSIIDMNTGAWFTGWRYAATKRKARAKVVADYGKRIQFLVWR